jgi:GNAT superfamily N-acetyltransferase
MVEIKEVKTKRDISKFVNFPHKLYKGVPYFVPFLNIDEKNKFDPDKNESYDDCTVVSYLALRDGEVVGRICGIIQKLYNQKTNQKRVRFSRFDCINDEEVSNALFSAVEKWAKEQGMEIIHGPMGYNDLDREGLLVDGFDQMSTFEEQYNFSYYPKLIEKYGFKKEVDWVEYRIFAPTEANEKVDRIAGIVAKRFKLKLILPKSIKWFIKNYKEQFFEVLDAAYSPLYGVVPFSEKMKDSLIEQFGIILNKDFLVGVVNEENKLVGFGLVFPSLSEAVNKSKGKIFPFGIFRMLKQIKKPKSIDMGLIAIRPEYQNKGVNAMVLSHLIHGMMRKGIQYAETNLMLEDNTRIQGQWSVFDFVQHKRRRSYCKKVK